MSKYVSTISVSFSCKAFRLLFVLFASLNISYALIPKCNCLKELRKGLLDLDLVLYIVNRKDKSGLLEVVVIDSGLFVTLGPAIIAVNFQLIVVSRGLLS